ncbi:MAG: glucokinase [Acidobacteria bacterium]|nr:glucokinase [Acidobacteriota bacterium]MYD70203.1 glucokinase [Acidobacteriota bacterium]MYJ05792.1 glucokinase [Acidobacteriota bacterium]
MVERCNRSIIKSSVFTLLAADVGGTKTVCGLFTDTGGGRPEPIAVAAVPTREHDSIDRLLARFLDRHGSGRTIDAAVLGVAGPVRDNASDLTNVPWRVEAAGIAERFGILRVRLLNDLVAMGHALPVLTPDELVTLQPGRPDPGGNAALIAPGTGLGETILHRVGGELIPVAAEPGHADFAARTEAEIELLRKLTARRGRASLEDVLCGPGLVNIHALTHGTDAYPVAGADDTHDDGDGLAALPRRITRSALAGRCSRCATTLDLFVGALGAEAGNLALRGMATAGVYLGGGIVPHILPALDSPVFLDPFRDKKPMAALMAAIPVHAIRTDHPAMVGAAVAAARLAAGRVV